MFEKLLATLAQFLVNDPRVQGLLVGVVTDMLRGFLKDQDGKTPSPSAAKIIGLILPLLSVAAAGLGLYLQGKLGQLDVKALVDLLIVLATSAATLFLKPAERSLKGAKALKSAALKFVRRK
jgi:hypothetical protein